MTEPALRFLTLGIELSSDDIDLLQTIHETLDRLTQRRKDRMPISGELEPMLREVILYRIVATAGGSIVNWNTGNLLCSFLATRALFETFAFLWDYDRAINEAKKTGTRAEFKALTEKRLAATRSPMRLERNPEWKATSILTLLDRMSKQYAWAATVYDVMSSRCHPNTEGIFETFVDLDTASNEVVFSGRNDALGSSFRLIMGITGLITDAELLFDKLEDATPTIAKEIQERDFKKFVAESDRQQKRFEQFGEDERQAFLGDPRGQFAIGRAFAAGGSFPMKDPFRAYFWLSLAAARGVNEAARYRDKIERDMAPEQVSEAQALAVE